MLMRLLMHQLCRSLAELRIVWRVFKRYRDLPQEEKQIFRLTDKRISRSLRLSLLWAILKIQEDTPHIVVLGLLGIAGLLLQVLWALVGFAGKGA